MPVLVMHSEDDQIVPYVAAGPLSAKLLRNGTFKTYKGFPHGMPTTEAEPINADLLAFLKKVSKWPHSTNPTFTLMRRPGVHFDCLEAGRSKGTNRKLRDCWRNVRLCREEDSRVGGPGCRLSAGDRLASQKRAAFSTSAISSLSILRCSCGMGKVNCVIQKE